MKFLSTAGMSPFIHTLLGFAWFPVAGLGMETISMGSSRNGKATSQLVIDAQGEINNDAVGGTMVRNQQQYLDDNVEVHLKREGTSRRRSRRRDMTRRRRSRRRMSMCSSCDGTKKKLMRGREQRLRPVFRKKKFELVCLCAVSARTALWLSGRNLSALE